VDVLKKTSEFAHREAYCLMKYASRCGTVVEWIWNSRDGVTPFIVTSRCGKEMSHVQWAFDVRIRNYKPLPGERIFVDATLELLKPAAEKVVRQEDPTAGGSVFETLVQNKIRLWLASCPKGTPWVVDGSYHEPVPAAGLSEAIDKARTQWQDGK
jgi:hypothetical protein